MGLGRITVSTGTLLVLFHLAAGSAVSDVGYDVLATEVTSLTVYSAYQDVNHIGGDKIWIMDTQNSQYVVLVTFVLSPMNCETDFIQVRDGIPPTSKLLGRWCDGKPRTILSTGISLRIYFHTNSSTSRSAVHFKYRGEISPDIISTYSAAITGGLAVGFVVAMAYLGFVTFCLFRKRKGDEKLITMSIVPSSNDTEAVMTTRMITGEGSAAADDIELEVPARGDNLQQENRTVHHTDQRGYDNMAFRQESSNDTEPHGKDENLFLVNPYP